MVGDIGFEEENPNDGDSENFIMKVALSTIWQTMPYLFIFSIGHIIYLNNQKKVCKR